jgi:hypothetical protein
VACGSGEGDGAVGRQAHGQEGSGAGQGRRRKGKKGRKEKKKGEEKKKRRKEKGIGKEKGKEIGKRFRKLGKLLGKLGGGFCGVFRFLGVSVIFGTAVTARQTGRRDRGGAGFPAWWPTAALGRHTLGDGLSAGGAGGIHGTRAEGERGGRRPGFQRGGG